MASQPADDLHVEMVGWLIEYQQVVAGQQDLGKRCPTAFTAGQAGHIGIEADSGQEVFDNRAGLGLSCPDVIGPSIGYDRSHSGSGGEVVGLAQVAHRQARCVCDSAGVGIMYAGQNFQQSGLAVAVTPDNPDGVAVFDPEAHSIEQSAGAIADRGAFYIDQVCHQPPMIGGAVP